MKASNYDSEPEEQVTAVEALTERKSKSNKTKFADAISQVLSTPAPERPVLSKTKGLEKSIDKEKLLIKQKKLLRIEKRKVNCWKEPIFNQNELVLKKIATKGVVQLFNAIKSAQKVKEAPAEQSKKVFLDSIKNVKVESKEPITVGKSFE